MTKRCHIGIEIDSVKHGQKKEVERNGGLTFVVDDGGVIDD